MRTPIYMGLLVLAVLVSGCISGAGTVEIRNADYENGSLLLTLFTNQSLSDVGIEIVGGGKTLCTKQRDMAAGTNHFEFTDCEVVEDRIQVTVSPPAGGPSTKEFSLGLPDFKLQEGYRYDYTLATCTDCPPQELSIYVTKDAQDRWEGFAGVKKSDQRAALIRYKINKSDLSLLATETLNESQVLQGTADYENISDLSGDASNALAPFILLTFKERGLDLDGLIRNKAAILTYQNFSIEGTEIKDGLFVYRIVATNLQSGETLGTVYAATTKPYAAVSIETAEQGGLTFKSSERRGFSLNDYAGYTLAEVRRSQPVPRELRPP